MIAGTNQGAKVIRVNLRASCLCGWVGNFTPDEIYLKQQIRQHEAEHKEEA